MFVDANYRRMSAGCLAYRLLGCTLRVCAFETELVEFVPQFRIVTGWFRRTRRICTSHSNSVRWNGRQRLVSIGRSGYRPVTFRHPSFHQFPSEIVACRSRVPIQLLLLQCRRRIGFRRQLAKYRHRSAVLANPEGMTLKVKVKVKVVPGQI